MSRHSRAGRRGQGQRCNRRFLGRPQGRQTEILEIAVVPGDYIVNHAGYAIRRIEPADVLDTLAMYEVVLSESGEDPILAELSCELETV